MYKFRNMLLSVVTVFFLVAPPSTIAGTIVGWGNNGWGQIDVPVGDDFVAIAAGYMHSMALKSDGSITAWGQNTEGTCNTPADNDHVATAGGLVEMIQSYSVGRKAIPDPARRNGRWIILYSHPPTPGRLRRLVGVDKRKGFGGRKAIPESEGKGCAVNSIKSGSQFLRSRFFRGE